MNRKAATLDALGGFLASRRRRRRYTGPERVSAILGRVFADLGRRAERARAQEAQSPPPAAPEKNLAEAGGIVLTVNQSKA